MAAPETVTEEGEELRRLFPKLLGRKPVFDRFSGFARREKHQIEEGEHKNINKKMSHYLRLLYNCTEMLQTGTMTIRIVDSPVGSIILAAKQGYMSIEEGMSLGSKWEEQLARAYENSSLPEQPDYGPANEFLLRMRRANW